MRANGRHEDDWVVWMTERSAGREVVGCAARWRCNDDAVGLDSRDVVVVAKDLNRRHCCGRGLLLARQVCLQKRKSGRGVRTRVRTAIEHEVVEDIVGQLRLMRVLIIGLVTYELLHEVCVLLVVLRALRTHHRRLQSQAQADHQALLEDTSERAAEVIKIELCQESKRAKRKRYDRWHDALEEP